MCDGVLRRDIISAVIKELESIEKWFTKQRQFAFYASSILIVFDGLESASQQCNSNSSYDSREECKGIHLSNSDSRTEQTTNLCVDQDSEDRKPDVRVRMIDFTHVFPSQEEDSNYLFGLRNLIEHLRLLLRDWTSW